MAKEVSVGVKVKLQADAKEMQRIIDDLETRLSNVKTDSSLGKSLSKQLQKMKDSLGDFNLLSGQQIINSSDLTTATTLAKNFYKQVGRFSEDYEKGSFSAFSFDKKQLKEFETAQKALEDFDKSRKDSLNKKTNGEVFGKYAEEAKGIQKAFKEIKKDVNEDSSFLDTKKDIEHSKKKAQEEVSATERKLVRETQLKQEADVAKQSAENNLKIKQQELAKVQKLEQNYQKRKEVADEISKKESFKDAKEFRDYFNSSIFQKGGTNFKSGGQEKASQMLTLMGFSPEEIPQGVKELKEKIAQEIANAPDDQVKNLAEKMYGNAKDFSSKGYKNTQKKSKTAISEAQKEVDKAQNDLNKANEAFEKKENSVNELNTTLSTQQLLVQQLNSLEQEIDALWKKLSSDEESLNKDKREELKNRVDEEREKVMSTVKGYTGAVKEDASKLYQGVHSTKEEEKARQQAEQEAANFKANLQASIKHWMGAQQVITLVRQGIRQAYQDIQGLDKAMTNIAVVTDFNVSDLWGKINDYMQVAQQYGVTTQGVYEVSQLYFQQGLGETDTMAATTETLKMARIAGMDYADAADGMTVAIRGFNMEMQDAARVTDVYSKVAAITASDTQELVTAMSKTASSAAAVGSSFENTTAMLAVMIEATRESPQNLGSALKSIISRYGEMTKGLSEDSEGEEIDYNRVDTALKTVGISLKDAQGQFRDFDTVIEELSAKWATLDSVTQRYIATIFAGNRQQSRFLALVSNYDRYMEVSEAAVNSEDAGLLQYSKTLDSLETKLNNIKTSFQQFYMSLINGDNVKGILDFINDLIKGLNKLSKFTSILNFGSIVIGVKTIGNLLINGFTSGMSQIQTNWRVTMQQLVEIARKGGIDSANAFNSGAQGMGKGGAGKQGSFSTGSKALLNSGLILGGALSLYGTSLAQKNQTAGAIVSGIGNMATYGVQGGLMGFSAGGPYGAAIGAAIGALGGLVSMISSIPTAVEKAQQKSEQAQQEAEEANVKRAEAKQRVSDLESGIDQLTDLSSKRFDSLEAEKEWLDANNAFYEKFPELSATFEDGTNAIVDLESAELLLAQARAEGAEAAREAAKKAYEQAKASREGAEAEKREYETTTINEVATGQISFKLDEYLDAYSLLANIQNYRASKEIQEKYGSTSLSINYSPTDSGGFVYSTSGSGFSKGYARLFSSGIDLTDENMLNWLFSHETMSEEAILQSVINNLRAGSLNFAKNVDEDSFVSKLTGGKYTTARKLIAAENLLTQKSIYASKAEEQADLNRTSVEVSALLDENFSQADFLELENVSSLIQKSIKQKHKESGKTFDEFESQIPALVNGAVEAQQLLWENLYGTGQIDEFNSLIQSMSSGKITNQIFNDQIVQLFGQKLSDLPEELQNAINLYYNDFTNNLKTRQDAVKTSLITNRKVTWEEGKVDVLLANVAETYYDQLIDFANIIETKIGEGTLTKEVGESQINGLIDLLNQTANLPIEQIGQAQQILLESDLFTTLGQQEAIQKLQEAGIDVSKINPTVISTYAENLITQYGTLQDKLISNLKSTTEALENASNGTTLEEASSIAKKVGKDVTELFDFQDGKYFAKNTETLNQIYTAYSDSQKEALNKSLTHQISLLDRGPLAEKGRIAPLTDEEQSEYNQLIEQYRDSALAWAKSLDPKSLAAEGLSDKSTDIDKIKAYLKDYSEDVSEAIDNETQWQLEQATKALAINNRTHELQGKGVGEDLRNAYSLLSSKGMTGYSAKEIAQLEQYLGVGEGGLGAIETGEGTGEYRIDQSKLANLPQWVQNAIGFIINDLVESAESDLKDLAEKIGAKQVTSNDYAQAFTGLANYFSPEALQGYIKNLSPEKLQHEYAMEMAYRAGDVSKWKDYWDEAGELMEETNAITVDASKENLLKFYELSQKKILGIITKKELEELDDFKPADLGLDTTEFTGNLISQLTQHAQAIIDGLASGTIVDFEAATDTLEKDMSAALSAKAYAKEFNIDENLIEGMNSLTLAYFSDAMETVRKSKNQFDADSAGKIATSIATMMGAGEEVASKVLDLFAYDLEEHSFSLELPSSFDELKTTFGLKEGEATATAIEQAIAQIIPEFGTLEWLKANSIGKGALASAGFSDVFNQAEKTIKNDTALTEEARQKALSEVQALKYFWDVASEAEVSSELEKFDESRAFIDGLKSTYETLASGEEITAAELKEIYEGLGQELDEGETYQNIIKQGSEAVLNNIVETIKAAAESGDISQNEASEQLAELQAIVLDAIISNISSGISSLGAGLEGTLSAADYQGLVDKYGLSGKAYTTSKGLQLSTDDQRKLISSLYVEANTVGLQGEIGDQIWEVLRNSTADAFDSINDLEGAYREALKEAGQKRIEAIAAQEAVAVGNASEDAAELAANTAAAAREAEAYAAALGQAFSSAMLDPDAYEFNFMDQDATNGLTKNFDNFVNQIDKVKSIFSSFQSGEAIGYQDFYNMMDFMDQMSDGALSDFSKEIDNSMPGLQKLQSQLIASGHSYEDFVNSVVANTDEWGKVDIGGVAAEMGISVDAAMSGMAEGMTDGLKEVARKQIQYLSGLEAMLEALVALESIGDISLGLGLEFTTTTGETITIDTLNDIVKYWEVLKPIDQKTLIIELQTALKDGNSDVDTALQKVFGKGFSLYDLLGGENFFTPENFDIGTIEAITSLSDLTQGQAYSLAMKMDAEIKLEEGSDFTIDENGIRQYTESGYQKLQDYIKQNYKDFYKVEEYPFDFEVANKANVKLAKEGIIIEGVDISGWSEMDDKMKTAVKEKVETAYAEEGLVIEVSPEGKLISTPMLEDVEAVNTNFQTAAEAASTLQTAITQISTVASTFQAGSEFQSLADQLNAAAEAAEKLIGALGGNRETTLPDTSAIEAELAAAQAIYESMGKDMTHGVIPMNYDELDAAQDRVIELQGQLDALKAPSSVATDLITELGSAVEIANQLSNALANNNGTPLEVNFNVDEANSDVTVLIANLLQLNAVFKPTIEIEDKASSILESIIQLIANISSKTVTITTVHKDVYATVSSSGNGGISDKGGKDDGGPGPFAGTMNGLAFADGSLGRLHSGAVLANKALVGELGPELAVYDGQYHMLGANGAEFVDLPSDAIIFNHLQTQGILRGQMNIRGTAMAEGNVSGPAYASGIGAALSAVRRAKSVWQGLLNSLSAADLMGAGGGGGGGGGGDESLKAHIADLQEWYNLSRQIADIEGQINVLLAKRKNITDGHEYLRNLRETQRLLDDQVNTQQDLLRFQELQLQRQAEHINNNKIWSQFLEVDENGLLQYKKGNETDGGKGALEVLSQMNEMSGEEQLAFVQSLGWSYTNTDGEELEDTELVAKFYEELQKQIDDYDALRDTVQETEGTLADLEEQINEIEREIRDNEIDLSKEIYDIIVNAWEENIENLKEQNDLIKEANEAYANGIQEAIDAERQMYDQNTAISDREQLQRQLALMRRSGGSASEIADLEQQLDDMLKEEYFSNQEKQLETIQKANERQVELMDQQVKLQEEALEYEKENGVIWTKVYEVMQGTDAEILDFMQGNKTDFFEQSALQQEDMLTEWAKKIGIYTEERQRQNYAAEAAKTFGNVWNNETGRGLQDAYNRAGSAQQEKWKREYNDTYASKMLEGKSHEEALALAQEEFYEHLRNWIKAEEDKKKQQQQQQQTTTSSSGQSSEESGTSERDPNQRWKASGRYGNSQGDRTDVAYGRTREEALRNLPHPRSFYNISYGAYQRYVKGGIIDYTGPAWVDGSKSKPERILSAEQNRILEEGLAMNAGRSDKLREMFSNFAENLGASVRASISNIANRTSSSAITIQPGAVQLNIEQLNDKYDVDELFNDVADRLYSIASKASGRGVSRR